MFDFEDYSERVLIKLCLVRFKILAGACNIIRCIRINLQNKISAVKILIENEKSPNVCF